MTMKKTKEHTGSKAAYEPTPAERDAVKKVAARLEGNLSVRLKVVSKDGAVAKVAIDHPNEIIGHALLMEVVKAGDPDFLHGILGQLAKASLDGPEIDERGLNFMLSIIKGIEPRDQVETMLAAQMAAVHMASMTFSRRLACVENIPQQDSAERAFNKLTRTFTSQMETLKRYRTGGEQKVTVQHVSTQAPRENMQDKAAAPASADTNVVPLRGGKSDPLPGRRKASA